MYLLTKAAVKYIHNLSPIKIKFGMWVKFEYFHSSQQPLQIKNVYLKRYANYGLESWLKMA